MQENNKSYRIRTNVREDKVLNVNINQDIEQLEILSLKIDVENFYKLHTSNYGCVVGRVLANQGIGVPNVKISVFIPVEAADNQNPVYKYLYPYTNTKSKNQDGVRYNLLPDSVDNNCHQDIGTFPNKRLVLDDNNVIEVFDKYYKYTTVTNNAGDYMLFGVPVGINIIHSELDLSDIGMLSQKPRDLFYKGYGKTLFENSSQFKKDTNLDYLTQVISQDTPVQVYSFWGDDETLGYEGVDSQIKITRNDIDINYKFEPTCIFIGSLVADDKSNGFSKKCIPTERSGKMDRLTTGAGTIEMIRKTPDNKIESFSIQGNDLIDGNGTWCYQIPMNLDYIKTDEFGNIVPAENELTGIPTKTTVRFRVSLADYESDSSEAHLPKILVPNNPTIEDIKDVDKGIDYNFGTYTRDDSFRDLFWNNVYTVKQYIPRLQNILFEGKHIDRNKNFSGIKAVNVNGNNNPIPYNNIRVNLTFLFIFQCIIFKALIFIVKIINKIIYAIQALADGLTCEGQYTSNCVTHLNYILLDGSMCPTMEGYEMAFGATPITAVRDVRKKTAASLVYTSVHGANSIEISGAGDSTEIIKNDDGTATEGEKTTEGGINETITRNSDVDIHASDTKYKTDDATNIYYDTDYYSKKQITGGTFSWDTGYTLNITWTPDYGTSNQHGISVGDKLFYKNGIVRKVTWVSNDIITIQSRFDSDTESKSDITLYKTDNPDANSPINVDNGTQNGDLALVSADGSYFVKCVELQFAMEYEVIQFDFYNDWMNGLIYLPRWFAELKKKKRVDYVSACNENFIGTRELVQQCALEYDTTGAIYTEKYGNNIPNSSDFPGCTNKCHKQTGRRFVKTLSKNGGIIQTYKNKIDDKYLYYLRPAVYKDTFNINGHGEYRKINLFATDIVLLGSVLERNRYGLPLATGYPSSTFIMPPPTGQLLSDTQEMSIWSERDYDFDTTMYIDEDGVVKEYTPEQRAKLFQYKKEEKTRGPIGPAWFLLQNKRQMHQSNDLEDGLAVEMSGIDWGYNPFKFNTKMEISDGTFSWETGNTRDIICTSNAHGIIAGDMLCYKQNIIREVDSVNSNIITLKSRFQGPSETQTGVTLYKVSIGDDTTKIENQQGGHFLEIGCVSSATTPKSCLNLQRICELGSEMSQSHFYRTIQTKGTSTHASDGYDTSNFIPATGIVSSREINAEDMRMKFAIMNSNNLKTVVDSHDKLYRYNFYGYTPNTFNGDFNNWPSYEEGSTNNLFNFFITLLSDSKSKSYAYFRFFRNINEINSNITNIYDKFLLCTKVTNARTPMKVQMPVYENSFYFYFGLKDGNTAIDRLYTEYFSECPNNNVINNEAEPDIALRFPYTFNVECALGNNEWDSAWDSLFGEQKNVKFEPNAIHFYEETTEFDSNDYVFQYSSQNSGNIVKYFYYTLTFSKTRELKKITIKIIQPNTTNVLKTEEIDVGGLEVGKKYKIYYKITLNRHQQHKSITVTNV